MTTAKKKTSDDMYKNTCEKRFDSIDNAFSGLHKRLFESNGDRAIVELIRDNKNSIDRHVENEPEAVAPTGTVKWGIMWQPIESRDVPRIIATIGIVVLLLERFGALTPLLEMIAKK